MQADTRDAGYVLDMLEHARGLLRAVQGRPVVEYLADEGLRLAIERRTEIIGEDVKTTTIYTHVFNRGPAGVQSPVDGL